MIVEVLLLINIPDVTPAHVLACSIPPIAPPCEVRNDVRGMCIICDTHGGCVGFNAKQN